MKKQRTSIRYFGVTLISLLFFFCAQGQESVYLTIPDIAYYADAIKNSDPYIQEKCRIDLYYPTHSENFPTLIWFHGGGLEGGEKFIPERLKNQGIAIVAVDYRLYPRVKNPDYLEDAAAAVAWVFKNIEGYGGDPNNIFVSGHSAGGYLASMIGIDKKWLELHELDANAIAGIIPLSGHMITHFTIRKERGISGTQPIIDEFAPLFHVRKDAPPFLVITGDRDLELLGRYEENAYFSRMMKVTGHQNTVLYELEGYGHQMTEPAFPIVLQFIQRKKKENSVGRR